MKWTSIGSLFLVLALLFSNASSIGAHNGRYDLSTVQGIDRVADPRIEALLAENGFAVMPQRTYAGVEEFYQWLDRRDIPIFVSTDAILHASHILFDYTLRILEIERLRSELISLTRMLVDLSLQQNEQAFYPQVQEAALRNAMFFSVALKLLDEAWTLPELVREEVEAEIALIEAHQGWRSSPVFQDPQSLYLYQEDYSQYIPRGHYTQERRI